jgi:hypothetical protein
MDCQRRPCQRRRTRYILGAALALAIVAFVVVDLWPSQAGVTQANYDRIEDGMTLEYKSS